MFGGSAMAAPRPPPPIRSDNDLAQPARHAYGSGAIGSRSRTMPHPPDQIARGYGMSFSPARAPPTARTPPRGRAVRGTPQPPPAVRNALLRIAHEALPLGPCRNGRQARRRSVWDLSRDKIAIAPCFPLMSMPGRAPPRLTLAGRCELPANPLSRELEAAPPVQTGSHRYALLPSSCYWPMSVVTFRSASDRSGLLSRPWTTSFRTAYPGTCRATLRRPGHGWRFGVAALLIYLG